MGIEYAEGYTAITKPVRRSGGVLGLAPGQSQSGYGNKISMDYMVQFPDAPHRNYRVYCVCYSNVGSLYIVKGGKVLCLKEYELEAALGR